MVADLSRPSHGCSAATAAPGCGIHDTIFGRPTEISDTMPALRSFFDLTRPKNGVRRCTQKACGSARARRAWCSSSAGPTRCTTRCRTSGTTACPTARLLPSSPSDQPCTTTSIPTAPPRLVPSPRRHAHATSATCTPPEVWATHARACARKQRARARAGRWASSNISATAVDAAERDSFS